MFFRTLRLALILVLLMLLKTKFINAQIVVTDEQLIKAHQLNQNPRSNQRPAMEFGERSWIAKYNPASLVAKGAMYVYQNAISPQISSDCLYHPSCSDFAKQCIQKYGFFKGVSLGADRLTRCTNLAEDEITLLKRDKNGNYIDAPSRYE